MKRFGRERDEASLPGHDVFGRIIEQPEHAACERVVEEHDEGDPAPRGSGPSVDSTPVPMRSIESAGFVPDKTGSFAPHEWDPQKSRDGGAARIERGIDDSERVGIDLNARGTPHAGVQRDSRTQDFSGLADASIDRPANRSARLVTKERRVDVHHADRA